MGIISNLFSKNQINKKLRAIAFVDFEHWYISLKNKHFIRPNIEEWYLEISEKYNMEEIAFFGDFTTNIGQELHEIRNVTNIVIDTQNPNERYKKDYTDFLMLDYIYRKSISAPNIDTYIIFTGDGHFSSVVNFLKNYCKKTVIIYGVKEAVSNQLKKAASEYFELPKSNKGLHDYCIKCIVENMAYVSAQPSGKIYPTFLATVDVISRNKNLPPEEVKIALQKMINSGYIEKKTEKIDSKNEVKIIYPNWDLLIKDGLWQSKNYN